MKNIGLFLTFLLMGTLALAQTEEDTTPKIAIAIHGGAGTILKANMTPEMENAYRVALGEALTAGYDILEKGGTSIDAITIAIRILEDSPLFNAGKGAVLTHEGVAELDAAIMDGATLNAGAIAGVRTIRNPIEAARVVMEKSPHVMLTGSGAEAYAAQQGLQMVENSYFLTEERKKQLERAKAKEDRGQLWNDRTDPETVRSRYGTVGAVAIDRNGNLAAGTSTGGMTNKRYGRIGDAPIIGAGTYASNMTCAVSCTGWGEYFIRNVVAYDVAAQLEYTGRTVAEAAQITIDKVGELGGDGGLIVVDRFGNVAMPFNSEGMYRGVKQEGKAPVISIYKED